MAGLPHSTHLSPSAHSLHIPTSPFLLSGKPAASGGLASVATVGSFDRIGRIPALRVMPEPNAQDSDRTVSIFRASRGQQRSWFLHSYAPDSPIDNLGVAVLLSGPLNINALTKALCSVVKRHDMLRTTFSLDDGVVMQRVATSSMFEVTQLSVENIPPETRRAEANRMIEEFVRRPFDLANQPQFRVALAQLGPQENVLVWALHAISADAESAANLSRDISDFYKAELGGQDVETQDLPVRFADHAAWLDRNLEHGRMSGQQAYWKTKLSGEISSLDLPSDRSRPATETFRGEQRSLALDSSLIAKLDVVAQAEGSTFFILLLTAFKTLLHRYTGHEDMIIGVPLGYRPQPELQAVVGPLTNSLAMRTAISSDLTFSELMTRVRQTVTDALANQDLPFDNLVEELNVPRDAARMPLFQSVFSVQEWPAEGLDLAGLKANPWPVTTRTSKYDLKLSVQRSRSGWTAVADYSTDLFDADRIERLLSHWQIVLESVAANPNQQIAHVPLLTTAEKHRLLVEWNQTEKPYPADRCVHQLFEEQTERTPDAVAAIFGEQTLSYSELNHRANRLAQYLRSLGVGPDVAVGLCVERSFEMVIAALATLKAGGAYVPLDPNLPQERLSFLLSDAACAVVITQTVFQSQLPTTAATSSGKAPVLVVLDALPADLPSASEGNAAPRGSPDTLAYVMFTSGSTGRPKGVEMPHRALVNLVHWQLAHSTMTAGSRTLQFASLGFDVSFQEIFSTWANGGTLILASDEIRKEPTALLEAVARWKIERIFLPFVMLERLAEFAEEQGVILDSVKEVIVAGEQLRIGPSIRRFFANLPGCKLWNHYGPTESHVVTAYELSGPPERWPDLPPIGRSLSNCQIYVLDSEKSLVPLGAIGELWIGGTCLARGYRQRPDLTSERFFANPFSQDSSARLYRTGDLCRFRADGHIEYLGRRDHQIKIRGYRVELGEIEAALSRHPDVAACCATAREYGPGEKILVSFVVPRPQVSLSRESLREFLKDKLPDYMIPVHFIVLDALPLSPNGKVDRKVLRKLEGQELQASTDHVAPRNDHEKELVAIWQEVLRRDKVGVHDNFFDLGGHSLLAARVATEVKKRLGFRMPISTLFQAPTVATLAEMLSQGIGPTTLRSLVALQPKGSNPAIFVIHGWGGDVFGFLELARKLAPDRPVYGLQALGLDGHHLRHTTVEEMAAHYAQEIRAWQPIGPYHLLGYSLGGWITYQVARELSAAGARLGVVTVLDTQMASANLPSLMIKKAKFLHFAGRARVHLKKLLHIPSAKRAEYFLGRLRDFRNHLRGGKAEMSTNGTSAHGSAPAQKNLGDKYKGWDYFAAAAGRYRPLPYHGDLVIMVPSDQHEENRAFWGSLVRGQITVNHVPGDHFTMVDADHAEEFAAIYRNVLHDSENRPKT